MKKEYIKKISNLALTAFRKKEIPVGAIIVDKLGNIVAEGYNLTHSYKDSCQHAEIRALKQAFKKLNDWRLDNYTLIVNLEPCLMCLGAIHNARIKKVIYFLENPLFGSVVSKLTKSQLKKLFPKLSVEKVNDKNKTKLLLKKFFKNLRK